jgi:multidrug efflux system membrane fusion protein
MRLLTRILLPVLVLVGAGSITFVTVANKVEPERRAPRVTPKRVDFVSLAPSDFVVWVKSRGTVRPRTESTLLPEVSGSITESSTKIRAGEFFERDDVLLRIDPRNYQLEVTVAEASLAQARAALAEEQARSAQAQREWKRLGGQGVVDDLVLRKPQLAGAQAQVRSAQASLARARLNLERTVIRAPYAGRVLQQNVDVGQYVSPGTTLARVYAVDYAEVRLPLANRQLEFVDIPEIYRNESPGERAPGAALELTARIGSRVHTWRGQVVRAEGAIDTQSRQIFVIGQIEDPYGKTSEGRPPLKVGQFVEARIRGRTLRGVYVIPRSALRAGARVNTLDAMDRVRSRTVEIVYSDEQHAVVSKGLSPQERLVTTALGAGMEGQRVRPALAGETADANEARGERRRTRRAQSKAAAL